MVFPDRPLFWAERNPLVYGVVDEGHAVRFQEHRLSGPRRIGIIVCLLFAILPVSFSIVMLSESFHAGSPGIPQTIEEGCGESHVESGDLLPGTLYCVPSSGPDVSLLETLEVSDDQHVRATFGGGDVHEYRWEAVDDYVVFGEIFDGEYECMTLLPQSNLNDDWTYADLEIRVGQYNPDWCGTAVDNSTRTYSADEPHPYDGIWLYDVEYGDPMNRLVMIKYDGLDILIQDGESEAYINGYVDSDERGGFPGELCLTVPLSLLFLVAADPRKLALYFHINTGKIVRKRVGRYPSFQTTLDEVNFASTDLQRTVRLKHHSDEIGSWTTEHPGFDLIIWRRNGPIVPVFFEDGGDPQLHESTILALLKGLDVDEQRYRSHLEAAEAGSIEAAAPPVQNAEAKDGAASGVLFTDAGDDGEDGPSRSSIHETTKPKLPEPDPEVNAFWSDIG